MSIQNIYGNNRSFLDPTRRQQQQETFMAVIRQRLHSLP